MVSDIQPNLPAGVQFFLVDEGEPASVTRHVLEKVYIPLPIFLDLDGHVGAHLYWQPLVGLPFARSFLIDTDLEVTDIFTGYSPNAALEAIERVIE